VARAKSTARGGGKRPHAGAYPGSIRIIGGRWRSRRLRSSSDVNLILVLRRFERAAAEAIEGRLNVARAAVGLRVMFLLEGEIAAAGAAFAQKFSDIARRRRVLYGEDVFAGLEVPRAALVARERQVLLNAELGQSQIQRRGNAKESERHDADRHAV